MKSIHISDLRIHSRCFIPFYGNEASMEIESTPDVGTCVTMRLPLEKGE